MDSNINMRIVTAPLPDGINGMLSGGDPERLIIMINSNLSAEEQEKAFLHECKHIWNDDLNSSLAACDVGKLEQIRH